MQRRTILKIPAQSLGGKDSIDFEITEFYEYSEMVVNMLTTKADNHQLISRGMLKLKASQDKKELDILPGKKVQVFVPGITEKDSMQIFKEKKVEKGDSTSFNVNWALSNMNLNLPQVNKYIRAIDFRDEYNFIYRESGGSRLKALFEISAESGLSRSRIKTMMRAKYPEY